MKIRNYSWSSFDKFSDISDIYLPRTGEGDSMATQIVTSVNKITYRWFNDGDVYDNTKGMYVDGGENMSSYANWLYKYVPETRETLDYISKAYDDEHYVSILYELCTITLNEDFLAKYDTIDLKGSIYDMEDTYFKVEWYDDEDDDDGWY